MNKSIAHFLLLSLLLNSAVLLAQETRIARLMNQSDVQEITNEIYTLFNADRKESQEVLAKLDQNWEAAFVPMLIDVIHVSRGLVQQGLIYDLLRKKTKQSFKNDLYVWQEWMWNQPIRVLPNYGDWLARIYHHIDPKFERYFLNRTSSSSIRLDEVRWGGVLQDGIPPLRYPIMINAEEADYLEDDNIVFGISINGDHRAYPKRILAWHEMFVDDIGGEPIAGVYCTLCGTVIAYNTNDGNTKHQLGTSGFLYRSNKLMYDQATQSLWNTIEGKPVIGPLVNSGIELKSHSVVTTSWKAWKKLHPDTKVLSLNTGHRRNYSEGFAYKDYFATDKLMFKVPKLDKRLLNKDEVLIIRAEGYQKDPLAISVNYLKRHKVYQDKIGHINFVVLTDKEGANRVYESKDYQFKKISKQTVKDKEGRVWQIQEDQLLGPNQEALKRLPYHRMFWFAWFNTYEQTRLVK